MHLSPKETDRLLLFLAAELARRRRARGLKLNYPEARALIADEICEGARDGKSVAELMGVGRDDPHDRRRAARASRSSSATLQVEAMFPDGQKLVTIHDPIGPGRRAGGGRRARASCAIARRRDRAERRPRERHR